LIFVGKGLGMDAAFRDSALYDAAHAHILRPVRGQKAAKT
jgi:precorrin-4 methylase